MELEKFYYDNKIVKNFTVATIFWGVVAFLVGITIALQLVFPALNFNISWLTFGRIRAIHTSAAIFAFASTGNAGMLATDIRQYI